ncbi:MAG TPA: TetR/AcrR family transcriptional regulator [Solirubrobacteraceae bacterium]|nr:TetR/AcrR family transcriptional regulator [Solirubrobacteraceae bacterium]
MIEAIAARGYGGTSVKHVIGLAGVSRRAFYEQFDNKEDCFLETFDLIVGRAIKRCNAAYRDAPGKLEERMGAAFAAFVGELRSNSKALHLALVDALSATPGARRRLRRTTGMFEGLLSQTFSERERDGALPPPVVRAIVGGLRRVAHVRLLEEQTEDLSGLTEAMLGWTLMFDSAATGELALRPCATVPFPSHAELPTPPHAEDGTREQLLRAMINLALRERYENVNSLRIADEAGVPIDVFLGEFADKEACYLAAMDMLGGELLHLVADPGLVSDDWPAAVCRTIEGLLGHLSENPAALISLSSQMLQAGSHAIENAMELALEVTTLLTEGAPAPPRSTMAIEGIAGALWHTFYCEVIAGRGHRLPELGEYLSYVTLTPFLGAEAAVAAVLRSRTTLPAAALGEVREDDADERRDHDHDDQRDLARAEDPIDLDAFQIEHREEGDEDREQHEAAGAHELAPAAPGATGLGAGSVGRDGHPRLDATRS